MLKREQEKVKLLNKFVQNSHFQMENISCIKPHPSKGRLYDHPRPERCLTLGPSRQRLPEVPAISVEKHKFCFSRPLFWLKYSSKGFYQTLKTCSRILTQTGRSYDPLSRRLSYPQFVSSGSKEEHLSGCYTLAKLRLHSKPRKVLFQVIKFLEFVIDSTAETLSLPEGKVLKVKCLCMKAISTPTISARQLASLLGALKSCRLGIWQAPLHIRY